MTIFDDFNDFDYKYRLYKLYPALFDKPRPIILRSKEWNDNTHSVTLKAGMCSDCDHDTWLKGSGDCKCLCHVPAID